MENSQTRKRTRLAWDVAPPPPSSREGERRGASPLPPVKQSGRGPRSRTGSCESHIWRIRHCSYCCKMENLTKEEFVDILRRQGIGFSRESSKYRGVTLHKCGRWEASMELFLGKKLKGGHLLLKNIVVSEKFETMVVKDHAATYLIDHATMIVQTLGTEGKDLARPIQGIHIEDVGRD